MSHPATELPQWTGRRFWGLAGILCLAQAGLILLFGARDRANSHLASISNHYFRLMPAPLNADQLTRTFFAIDPTVFPLPNPHGFSERAWLRAPMNHFEVPSEMESPAWLALNSARLGTDFPPVSRDKTMLATTLTDDSGPEMEPWPLLLPPEQFRSQSLFELQGELGEREISPAVELPLETNAQLLSNSVVQIAVDSAGQVVAARLLGRSGSTDADKAALDQARGLRFRPAASPAAVWGDAVFEWQTVEPTNATAVAGP
jgi:TonB family protein